jgi:hypothetical protein
MPLRVIGGVFDSFLEQVLWSTLHGTAPVYDDFRTAAVSPLSPTRNTQWLDPAYGTTIPGATTDNWNSQIRQLNKQT